MYTHVYISYIPHYFFWSVYTYRQIHAMIISQHNTPQRIKDAIPFQFLKSWESKCTPNKRTPATRGV